MQDFRDFLVRYDGDRIFKRIELADGTTLSIQANEYAYCTPRKTFDSASYYHQFEIGFPSRAIPEIMEYAESPENPTDTVYGYVPYELIQDFINKAGGVKSNDTKTAV